MDVLSLFDLSGQTAVVTGGGQGIGREFSIALAEAGADVVVVQRKIEVAEEAAEDIRTLGREAIALKVDVTREDDVKNMVKTTIDKFGKIDILVNNAGVGGGDGGPAEEMSVEEWNRVVGINLSGVFICSHCVGPEMIKRKKGSVINVSSISGFAANHPQKQSHYNAAKGGVNTLTKCLAYEWAEYHIRVNAIAPGFVDTPMTKGASDENHKIWADLAVQKRIAGPEEFKGIVVFLASEAASYVTGHILVADGGYLIW